MWSNRDEQIKTDFLAGDSYETLSRRYGLTIARIRQILRRYGVFKSDRPVPRKRKSPLNSAPLSDELRKFGVNVAYLRQIELGLGPAEFAQLVGTSVYRLRAIECGVADCTYLEMQRLVEHLGTTISHLTDKLIERSTNENSSRNRS